MPENWSAWVAPLTIQPASTSSRRPLPGEGGPALTEGVALPGPQQVSRTRQPSIDPRISVGAGRPHLAIGPRFVLRLPSECSEAGSEGSRVQRRPKWLVQDCFGCWVFPFPFS